MKERAFIGIDPGISGCAALLLDNMRIDELYDFDGIKSAGHKINIWRSMLEIKAVALENPGLALHRGKGTLNSKFLVNRGQWEGILSAYYLNYYLVSPRTWQAKYKLMFPKIKGLKQRSIAISNQLFPESMMKIYLVKHEHRAEATLLAKYAMDKFYAGKQEKLKGVA